MVHNLGAGQLPTVQGAASVALARRPPAGRAFAGLSPASLARPIGAKAPRDTLLKVAICHAEISASYGVLLYPIIGGGERVGWLGPRTAARAKLTNADWARATPVIGRQYEVTCPWPLAPL